MGFFFERVQLRVYSTLSDVLYVILKVFRSSTRFFYIGQKISTQKKFTTFWSFQGQKRRIWLNPNRANFLICYRPKFSLCHGILSSISICMGLIVKNASERARPRAQPLKIKPSEKYRFSNLVWIGRIIYHSTQNHETNSTMYHLSAYLQGIKILIQKTKFYQFFAIFSKLTWHVLIYFHIFKN